MAPSLTARPAACAAASTSDLVLSPPGSGGAQDTCVVTAVVLALAPDVAPVVAVDSIGSVGSYLRNFIIEHNLLSGYHFPESIRGDSTLHDCIYYNELCSSSCGLTIIIYSMQCAIQ